MWQFFSLLNGRTTTMTDDESIILNMICADAGLDREKEIESSIQRNDLHMADMLKALPMAADEESQRNLPSEVRVRAYFESQTCLAKTCNIPSRPKAE
jgi:hypothetical protein